MNDTPIQWKIRKTRTKIHNAKNIITEILDFIAITS